MQNPTLPFGHELFCPPYKEKIQKVLPTLFNMVELENRRGNRLGMEVGDCQGAGAHSTAHVCVWL